MEWQQIYKDRSMDVETMLDRFVGDGTSVFVGTFEVAGGLIRPMLKRIQDGALHGISMYGGITSEDLHLDELTVGFDEFHYHNYFTGGNERNGISAGHTAYVPLHLHRTKNLVENDGIDVAFIAMTPPEDVYKRQNSICYAIVYRVTKQELRVFSVFSPKMC